MRKKCILFFLIFSCLSFVTCERRKQPLQQDFLHADVSYISQRVKVMVVPEECYERRCYSEGNFLFIGGLAGVIERRTHYLPDGTPAVFDRGGSEGLIRYSETDNNYLPFSEEMQGVSIQAHLSGNYIIDTHEEGRDTIRDFVILEDLHIIMSEDNYRIYEEQLSLPKRKRSNGERITFYRYK